MAYTVPKLTDFSPDAIEEAVLELRTAFETEAAAVLEQSQSPDLNLVQKGNAFDEFRNRWQARKNGIATQVNEIWLREAPVSAKKVAGQSVNKVRFWLDGRIPEVERQANLFRHQTPTSKATQERVDITLPGVRRPIGAEHPVIRTMHEIVGVFQKLGYSVAEGPVVETDYYNFEALNFPPNHPARDTHCLLYTSPSPRD